jgi:2-(1,2-epoxy-1,2-dihydrophenyl)acetyl-CoA isomerase
MNRPERLNALNAQLMDELRDLLMTLATDSSVRCVVLTGAGRAFCAGGDLDAVRSGELKHEELRRREECAQLLYEMPKPTIAMVNGAAAGAGLCLALACDLRIANEGARFGTAFVQVGFSGDFGGSWTLQRLVGLGKARELYFLGDVIGAADAERIGMVNRVVPADRLEEETMAWAGRIASYAPLAVARLKRNLNLALTSDLPALLDTEADAIMILGKTDDSAEAVNAFLEKRRPVYRGR